MSLLFRLLPWAFVSLLLAQAQLMPYSVEPTKCQQIQASSDVQTRLGLVLDTSRSYANQLLLPQPSQIRPLLIEMARCGGEAAAFYVRERGRSRGELLYLAPPQPAPTKPTLSGPLGRRAQLQRDFDRAVQTWSKSEIQRLKHAEVEIDGYLERLTVELKRPPSKASAFVDAVMLAQRFVQGAGAEAAVRVIAIFSDGVSAGSDSPRSALRRLDGVATLWVDPAPWRKSLVDPLRPTEFTDSTQLLRHASGLIARKPTSQPIAASRGGVR